MADVRQARDKLAAARVEAAATVNQLEEALATIAGTWADMTPEAAMAASKSVEAALRELQVTQLAKLTAVQAALDELQEALAAVVPPPEPPLEPEPLPPPEPEPMKQPWLGQALGVVTLSGGPGNGLLRNRGSMFFMVPLEHLDPVVCFAFMNRFDNWTAKEIAALGAARTWVTATRSRSTPTATGSASPRAAAYACSCGR